MKKHFFLILTVLGLIACEDNDSYSNNLKGKWDWKSTCGGFVGCVYASETGERSLIIESSSLKIIDQQQQVTFEHQYIVKKITRSENSTHYELELDNGAIWNAEVSNTTLDIIDSINFGSSYKRVNI